MTGPSTAVNRNWSANEFAGIAAGGKVHSLFCCVLLFILTIFPGMGQAAETLDVSGLLLLNPGDKLQENWQLKTFFSIAKHTEYVIEFDAVWFGDSGGCIQRGSGAGAKTYR